MKSQLFINISFYNKDYNFKNTMIINIKKIFLFIIIFTFQLNLHAQIVVPVADVNYDQIVDDADLNYIYIQLGTNLETPGRVDINRDAFIDAIDLTQAGQEYGLSYDISFNSLSPSPGTLLENGSEYTISGEVNYDLVPIDETNYSIKMIIYSFNTDGGVVKIGEFVTDLPNREGVVTLASNVIIPENSYAVRIKAFYQGENFTVNSLPAISNPFPTPLSPDPSTIEILLGPTADEVLAVGKEVGSVVPLKVLIARAIGHGAAWIFGFLVADELKIVGDVGKVVMSTGNVTLSAGEVRNLGTVKIDKYVPSINVVMTVEDPSDQIRAILSDEEGNTYFTVKPEDHPSKRWISIANPKEGNWSIKIEALSVSGTGSNVTYEISYPNI